MSHVTCHMSHVTCHMSHVTCHTKERREEEGEEECTPPATAPPPSSPPPRWRPTPTRPPLLHSPPTPTPQPRTAATASALFLRAFKAEGAQQPPQNTRSLSHPVTVHFGGELQWPPWRHFLRLLLHLHCYVNSLCGCNGIVEGESHGAFVPVPKLQQQQRGSSCDAT